MAFHIGQKVVCVDVSGNHHLKLNSIYTVAGHGVFSNSERDGIFLKEPTPQFSGIPFFSNRFRPLIERKTDISIFTSMLSPTSREVEKA